MPRPLVAGTFSTFRLFPVVGREGGLALTLQGARSWACRSSRALTAWPVALVQVLKLGLNRRPRLLKLGELASGLLRRLLEALLGAALRRLGLLARRGEPGVDPLEIGLGQAQDLVGLLPLLFALGKFLLGLRPLASSWPCR
jgi:hypothetical protein